MNKEALRLAYILISITLFLPVLAWPLPMLLFDNPMLAKVIEPAWFLSSVVLLICAISMDSMLYIISDRKQAFDAMLWVAIPAMLALYAFQNQNNTWMIALIFLAHSFRSAFPLLQKRENQKLWWLWLAWCRDTTAAVTILLWLSNWKTF